MIRRTFIKTLSILGLPLGSLFASASKASLAAQDADKETRKKFWLNTGNIIDSETLDPLNPFNANYPAWPSSERRFLLLHTNQGNSIAFTDGLSDVSDSDHRYVDKNGLELELFLETHEKLDTIKSGWAANILLEASRVVVNHGAVKEKLDTLKFITIQLEMSGAPEEWSLPHKDGNIGLFLGIPRPDFPKKISLHKTFFSPVSIKLMRPTELKFAIDNGTKGREKLAELYVSTKGLGHISSLSRPPVI